MKTPDDEVLDLINKCFVVWMWSAIASATSASDCPRRWFWRNNCSRGGDYLSRYCRSTNLIGCSGRLVVMCQDVVPGKRTSRSSPLSISRAHLASHQTAAERSERSRAPHAVADAFSQTVTADFAGPPGQHPSRSVRTNLPKRRHFGATESIPGQREFRERSKRPAAGVSPRGY
jgi:hypothetical protein